MTFEQIVANPPDKYAAGTIDVIRGLRRELGPDTSVERAVLQAYAADVQRHAKRRRR